MSGSAPAPRRCPAVAVGLRTRLRRPSYAATLLASAGPAYLAVPAADGHWTVIDADGSRGDYDTAYVGAVVALAGALWLALGGFYAVRGAYWPPRRCGRPLTWRGSSSATSPSWPLWSRRWSAWRW